MIRSQLFHRSKTCLHHIRRSISQRNLLALADRGFFQDLFPDTAGPEITKLFTSKQQTIYAGFDPKSDLSSIRFVNNASWYENLNVVDFVANMGRHFRMGSMLSISSVQSRLESVAGMSFTEFTYQIFQAYDWLLQKYDCRFQMGGSGQMGNLMTGRTGTGRDSR